MKERGQVFTTDMIFALILTAALISISGQAYALASGQMKSYSTRYSLERVANDAADILVKSAGYPKYWENQAENLKTLGLAKVGRDNKPITNYIDSHKLTRFAGGINGDSWNPKKEETDKAIKNFFGTSKFEIVLLKDENIILKTWPGWSGGEEPNSENAAEIAVVERYVYGRLGYIPGESPPLLREGGGNKENLEFYIHKGELDQYDWYVYVENIHLLSDKNAQVEIGVNDKTKDYTFKHPSKNADNEDTFLIPQYAPHLEGGMEDDTVNIDVPLEEKNQNFLHIKLVSVPGYAIKVYVVAMPPDVSGEKIARMIQERPLTLRVKLWR